MVEERRRSVKALVAAASAGDLLEVERLLKQDPHLVDARAPHDQTPLTAAAREGQSDAVRFLVARGASVDLADSTGKTALYWACQRGHVDVVGTLLDGGADPGRREGEGWTALMVAAMRGHLGIVRLLLHRGGQPANQTLPDGRSVLFVACHYANDDVARCLLLEGGADPRKSEAKNGMTPLRIARLLGHQKCIDVLEVRKTGSGLRERGALCAAAGGCFPSPPLAMPCL